MKNLESYKKMAKLLDKTIQNWVDLATFVENKGLAMEFLDWKEKEDAKRLDQTRASNSKIKPVMANSL